MEGSDLPRAGVASFEKRRRGIGYFLSGTVLLQELRYNTFVQEDIWQKRHLHLDHQMRNRRFPPANPVGSDMRNLRQRQLKRCGT